MKIVSCQVFYVYGVGFISIFQRPGRDENGRRPENIISKCRRPGKSSFDRTDLA